MDPSTALALVKLVIVDFVLKALIFCTRQHGPDGLYIYLGSRTIWQLQAEVVNLDKSELALNLKKLVEEESQIVAVAASIVIQIALAAFSLDGLSRAHWTARASLVLSLVSASMAVYFTRSRYRTFCRFASTEDIKEWIEASHCKPFPEYGRTENQYSITISIPLASSVIILSAPFVMLAVALHSFLVGFVIWLGFVQTRDLGHYATHEDSLTVFIIYAIGLGTCYTIPTLSTVFVDLESPLHQCIDDLHRRALERMSEQARSHLQGLSSQQRDEQTQAITPAPSRPDSMNQDISNALRHTAQLRKTLTESEEHLAELYERLGSRLAY
ncbi:hypothetical protein F5Y14DRAFT_450559 [Nemania sp. NC0429]|nr:hypothetical protein F5Y14DRAFT_450559 [Nemania sp. NC0429]